MHGFRMWYTPGHKLEQRTRTITRTFSDWVRRYLWHHSNQGTRWYAGICRYGGNRRDIRWEGGKWSRDEWLIRTQTHRPEFHHDSWYMSIRVGRDTQLACFVFSPAPDFTIVAQGTGSFTSCCNGTHTGQVRHLHRWQVDRRGANGDTHLSLLVVSPAPYSPTPVEST
jgi:hypothetical protein